MPAIKSYLFISVFMALFLQIEAQGSTQADSTQLVLIANDPWFGL